MKRNLIIMALLLASMTIVNADDRPVTFNQLPSAAQTFINKNYPGDKVSFATVDDDFIRPDYHVALVSGVMLQFENDGSLEKVETRNGNIPEGIIPVQILQAVNSYYPDATILGYEVGRRSYEVKLSNRLELKFNSRFELVELDD
jgi:hypothetical protein